MTFYQKLVELKESLEGCAVALSRVLAEWEMISEGTPKTRRTKTEPESEILLTRSARNRRSAANQVVTMEPLNGAPAVPESWLKYTKKSKGLQRRAREWIYRTINEYEPMTRAELSALAFEDGIRTRGRKAGTFNAGNWSSMVQTMLRSGLLKEKRGKIYIGRR